MSGNWTTAADIAGALALMGLCLLPVGLARGWRRLRGLDRIEAAEQSKRVAHRMTIAAQEQREAAELQLAACRALLAVAMRDRDHYEAAVEVLAARVCALERQRRAERFSRRYWLTRTITTRKVSEN